MTGMTAPLPDAPSAAAASSAVICPYLLADGGAWRSASPAREHRCTAVAPAAALAPDKQRRLCLTSEHTGCATFLVATGQGERESTAPVRVERVTRPGSRVVVRTVPVVLDHSRMPVAIPDLPFERHLGQVALIALMAVAFLAILLARLPGDGAGGGLGGAGAVVPTPTAKVVAASTPTPEPTPRPTPARTLVPTEVEPSAGTAEPTATPKATKEPTGTAATYKVKRGDTLSGIAAEFGTTVKVLKRLNGIDDPSKLRVGQVLQLP